MVVVVVGVEVVQRAPPQTEAILYAFCGPNSRAALEQY